MKFTDDSFIKLLLNSFDKNLDAFLKVYSLEDEQIGKNLAFAKSTAVELFNQDIIYIGGLSPVIANISGAIKTQLNLLDEKFYKGLDKTLSIYAELDNSNDDDDKRELLNQFPNHVQSLLNQWEGLMKRINYLLSNPSELARARESWARQPDQHNEQPDHDMNSGLQMKR